MKKLLVVCLLLFLLPMVVPAADGLASFGYGLILEKGQTTESGYAVGLDLPFVTKKNNYELVTEITYLYSDKNFESNNDLEAYRAYVIGRKQIIGEYLTVGFGTGGWNITDSDGENFMVAGYNIQIGGTFKVEYTLGLDIMRKEGTDLYYPYIQIRLLSL